MNLILLTWTAAAIAPIAIPAFLLFREKSRRAGCLFLVGYSVVYVGLSLGGQYVARDAGGGWANQPQHIVGYWWCPLGFGTRTGVDPATGRPVSELNALGGFFWPLFLVDRSLIHPNPPPSRPPTS